MARVRTRDTDAELIVRRYLHRLGYRYRLQQRDLPGTPDIVLSRRKSIIFVNGCFWHGHDACPRGSRPKSNEDFWEKKIAANIARDAAVIARLENDGWRVQTIWECETKNELTLRERLCKFLEGSRA